MYASRRKPRDLAAVPRRRAAQDLHGDLVAERDVLRGVDDADAARPDLAPDAVLPAEHGSGELARRRADIAAQLEPALERGDAVALERARRFVLARAVPQKPAPPPSAPPRTAAMAPASGPPTPPMTPPSAKAAAAAPVMGPVRWRVPSHVTW